MKVLSLRLYFRCIGRKVPPQGGMRDKSRFWIGRAINLKSSPRSPERCCISAACFSGEFTEKRSKIDTQSTKSVKIKQLHRVRYTKHLSQISFCLRKVEKTRRMVEKPLPGAILERSPTGQGPFVDGLRSVVAPAAS